jgi:broad specificity phosphatase PhoE
MKVFFARHGEYQNPENIVPFRLPGFPLSQLGEEQARITGNRLKSENIRDLFTSPVERCLETARIIGKILNLHPNVKDSIIETGTPLQGLTHDELLNHAINYPYSAPAHEQGGGESPEDIFKRMSEFIDNLKLMSQRSSHLVVSHADPIMIYLLGTLKKTIPHTRRELDHGLIRYIPMGGLVMVEFGKQGMGNYRELI